MSMDFAREISQDIIPPQTVLWRKKYPSVITIAFSIAQIFITFIIMACEVGSMLVDIITGTIYAGIWGGVVFLIASVSQSASACCFRERNCAKFTLVFQILSIIFSLCIIGINSYYMIYPYTCFFSEKRCNVTGLPRGWYYTPERYVDYKIPLMKVQLAAGCIMLILCIVYIIIYITTINRIKRHKSKTRISTDLSSFKPSYSTQVLPRPNNTPLYSPPNNTTVYSPPNNATVYSPPNNTTIYTPPNNAYYVPTASYGKRQRTPPYAQPTYSRTMQGASNRRPVI